MTQTAFVDSLVDRFDMQYETQISASVKLNLGPKRIHEKEGDWPYKEAVGGLLWISEMARPDITSAVSGPTYSQFDRATLEGGSENDCLPQGN